MSKNNPEFVTLLKEIQADDIKMYIAKNTDYGDSFREFGRIGILVRVIDKLKRAIQVLTVNELKVDSESVRDTLNDIRIYALMNEGLWREAAKEIIKVKQPISNTESKTFDWKDDDKAYKDYLMDILRGAKWKNYTIEELENLCIDFKFLSGSQVHG